METQTTSNADRGVEQQEPPGADGGNAAITILNIYAKELKTTSTHNPAHGYLQKFILELPKLVSNQVSFSR